MLEEDKIFDVKLNCSEIKTIIHLALALYFNICEDQIID